MVDRIPDRLLETQIALPNLKYYAFELFFSVSYIFDYCVKFDLIIFFFFAKKENDYKKNDIGYGYILNNFER